MTPARASQHAVIAEDVAALAKQYAAHEAEGERTLQAMQVEMQASLRQLEASYYSSAYR